MLLKLVLILDDDRLEEKEIKVKEIRVTKAKDLSAVKAQFANQGKNPETAAGFVCCSLSDSEGIERALRLIKEDESIRNALEEIFLEVFNFKLAFEKVK